jgi:hypothetical protein
MSSDMLMCLYAWLDVSIFVWGLLCQYSFGTFVRASGAVLVCIVWSGLKIL